MNRRFGILTGGGDVPPLNSVITAVKREAEIRKIEIFGFINGWDGLLNNKYIDLSSMDINPNIGGTILRSSRVNLATFKNVSRVISTNLKKLNIDGLIVIGGEDTLSNAFFLPDFPVILISKTIDNDVGLYSNGIMLNDFTLGYPTAVERISKLASLQYGLRTTAYSHERIIVLESMGMHAGWLALGSALGNPDFIIIPEVPVEYSDILEKIRYRYCSQHHLIIVISEGAQWSDGSHFSADYSNIDDFGHPKFMGAASALVSRLKDNLRDIINVRNINAVNPAYYYRSGQPNSIDKEAAELLGRQAVFVLDKGIVKPVFLGIKISSDENLDLIQYDWSNLADIEEFHRFVPDNMYNSGEYCITQEGRNYLKKFCQEIPDEKYGISVF